MSEYLDLRKEVCEYAKKMKDANLVIGSSGNVSARIPDENKIVITPTSVDYDKMKPEGIIVIDFDRNIIIGERAPSFESTMHIEVYKNRQDVGAVFHTHSVFATVLSVVGEGIPPIIEELVPYIGGDISIAEYGQSGSKELAKNAVFALGNKSAVLLANHGNLCVGKNLEKAFKNCLLVENAAKIYVFSKIIGKPNLLPEAVINLEKEFYNIIKKM